MNHAELIEHVATTAGIEKAKAKKAVEAITTAITTAAKDGAGVALPGFGQFKVKDMPARTGRNPSTGEAIDIAASKKLAFIPAKAVKDALNG